MGNLETESTKRAKKANVKKIILQSVATAGLISVAVLAPNVLTALKKLGFKPNIYGVKRSRENLVRKGLIKYEGKFLRLTEMGERELNKMKQFDFSLNRPQKWDKKWRVLVFDIPEYRRKIRDDIRRTLHSIGFMKMQNSVWVYPYDCEDYINLIKADLKIGKDLLYMIVDTIEYDRPIKNFFNLK